MTATIEQGWQALRSGDFQQAEAIFDAQLRSNPHAPSALGGLGHVMMEMGRLGEAQTLAQQALNQEMSAPWEALMGEILGKQGKRVEAERQLESAVARQPHVGYFWALLAEQRLRQGRWQDGTETYVRAIEEDRDGLAFVQLQCVIADMVDAIHAGRIQSDDGLRFINRLDYTLPNKTQEISAFFGLARRSLNGGQSIPKPGRRLAGGGSVSQPAHSARSGPPPNASRGSSHPPNVSPPPPTMRAPAPSRPAPSTASRAEQARDVRQQDETARLAEANRNRLRRRDEATQARTFVELGGGRQKSMVESIQEERMLNECLQEMVAAATAPEWPSAVLNPIDEIAAIGFRSESILGGSSSIRTADFRLTGGDIIVEIVLERCMHNLLDAASTSEAGAISFRPASISRIELSCWDGLLERLPPLDSLYREEVRISNYRLLGLGKFVAECIVRTYGGIWSYGSIPEESVIHLGQATLKPFDLVRRWLEAQDQDQIDLNVIDRQARAALSTSSSIPTYVDYIDPTPGLEGQALCMMLAELWNYYRFDMLDADTSEIAADMELWDVTEKTVLFMLNRRWAPTAGAGPSDSAVNEQGKVAIGYVRETGEFLLLGSKKHCAHFMGQRLGRVDEGTARDAIKILESCHRPGWRLVESDARARAINEQLNVGDLSGPRLQATNGGGELRVWTVEGRRARQHALVFNPSAIVPWQLKVTRDLG